MTKGIDFRVDKFFWKKTNARGYNNPKWKFYGTIREFSKRSGIPMYKIMNDIQGPYPFTFAFSKGWQQYPIPTPGSDDAVDVGCVCAILDNNHGKGWKGVHGIFVIMENCPLHGG